MNGNASNKLYTAKDILKYLGVDANTLYHWVQTRGILKPEIEVRGRGKSHQFSIENLATLYLIKSLQGLGFDPVKIKQLIDDIIKSGPEYFLTNDQGEIKTVKYLKNEESIWTGFKRERDEFQKRGLYLTLLMKLGGSIYDYKYALGDAGFVNRLLKRMNKMGYISLNAIDLVAIISHVEEQTGERL